MEVGKRKEKVGRKANGKRNVSKHMINFGGNSGWMGLPNWNRVGSVGLIAHFLLFQGSGQFNSQTKSSFTFLFNN